MTEEALIVFAAVLGTILLFGVALGVGMGGARAQLRKRALGLNRRGSTKRIGAVKGTGAGSLRRTEARTVPLLEELSKRYLPRQSELRHRLMRTGLPISIGMYVAASLAVAVAAGGGLGIAVELPPAAAALGGLTIGLLLPHLVVGFLGGRRRSRFIALLPDAMDLIVRGLKSGLPVTESMASAGREMADPLGIEFRRITDSVRMGRSLDDVLWECADRLQTPEFNFFVISLSIQRETGGNLAETLANLSDILRRRRQMRLKIKALSSEARASAYILGGLPFVMYGLVNLVNPAYASVLTSDPRGIMLLAVGGVILLIGFGVMAKMVRFEI